MKRLAIIFVILMLVCALWACNGKTNNTTTDMQSDAATSITADSTMGTAVITTTPSKVDTTTKNEQEKSTVANSLFDGTYWALCFGQTMGANYYAKFNKNGTFSAISLGSLSIEEGTYKYENGTMIVNFGNYKNIQYNKQGDEFVSVKEYQMQVGTGRYTIAPDDEGYEFMLEYKHNLTTTTTTTTTTTKPTTVGSFLADGEYMVEIYRNGTTVKNGQMFEKIGVLEYVEVSNDTILNMKVGDTISAPGLAPFTVKNFKFYEDDTCREVYINDREYECTYRKDRNTWVFGSPSGVADRYIAGTYVLPFSGKNLVDTNTPMGYGNNVYGEEYNGQTGYDNPIFALSSLDDYFDYHSYSNKIQASITITNGVIARVIIHYNPVSY